MNLKTEQVAVGKLTPHPQNVRQGDVGAISMSLEMHGQYRPIVAQKSTGYILAGNHTYKAAMSLGWKDIAVTYVDVDDDQALRILLMDNRANDIASYDEGGLGEVLSLLMDTEKQLAGTGFNPEDLDELLALVTGIATLDPAEAFAALPDGDRPNATQMTFTLTLDQGEMVKEALALARSVDGYDIDTGNENSNGNALALIAQEFIRVIR
jgi:ParB-like chromosome segregation protein Spo0J